MIRYDINKLEYARRVKGLKKGTLAKRVGVCGSAISAIWSGRNKDAETVKNIADVLGVSIEDILIEDSPDQPTAPTRQHGVERRRAAL